MPLSEPFTIGEFRRTLDERCRVAVPNELVHQLAPESTEWILAKERPGALSLWDASRFKSKMDAGVDLVKAKMKAGRLDGRMEDVQRLGRLLSTRQVTVKFDSQNRVTIPPEFRSFLDVEPGSELLVVGAAVCVEIWNSAAWIRYLAERMPEFRQLLDELSG